MSTHSHGRGAGPLARYEAALSDPGFHDDAAQRRAVRHLQRLHEALLDAVPPPRGLGARVAAALGRRPDPGAVRGVYLWGGVGRGKTRLVDMFFECLPLRAKRRTHFHRFMHAVHGELKRLHEQTDPLARVAEGFANEARVLCFDEFHVSDITDAMVLGRLLEHLFERGVTLVATSNEAPADLYRGGLQRERFLPAIALLEAHTEVVHLDGDTDYRLRALERAEIYHHPLDARAGVALAEAFEWLAPEPGRAHVVLDVEGRPLPTVRWADGIAWCEFAELCERPRGAADYIELARCHQTLLLAGIRCMDAHADDAARRFVNLVDELYDRNVKLVASAEAAPERLYRGRRLAREFRRTASRLREMQTHAYLARPHLSD